MRHKKPIQLEPAGRLGGSDVRRLTHRGGQYGHDKPAGEQSTIRVVPEDQTDAQPPVGVLSHDLARPGKRLGNHGALGHRQEGNPSRNTDQQAQ